MTLQEFFKQYPSFALAFSGGTDSSYLLYAALQYGAAVQPYFIKTPFQPEWEWEDAVRFTKEQNVLLKTIEYDILTIPRVTCNDALRCYHCKSALFSLLLTKVKEDGFSLLADGTNASDNAEERPGMRALKELDVISPLRLCGITKEEVKSRSLQAGLFTAQKPSYSCLATRIPQDTAIRRNDLERIDRAENFLFRLGFTDFRVRLFGEAAKLEIKEEDFSKMFSMRNEIREFLSSDFKNVLLDCKGR